MEAASLLASKPSPWSFWDFKFYLFWNAKAILQKLELDALFILVAAN